MAVACAGTSCLKSRACTCKCEQGIRVCDLQLPAADGVFTRFKGLQQDSRRRGVSRGSTYLILWCGWGEHQPHHAAERPDECQRAADAVHHIQGSACAGDKNCTSEGRIDLRRAQAMSRCDISHCVVQIQACICITRIQQWHAGCNF